MTLKWSSATDQLYAVSNSSPSLDLDFASNKSLLDNISGFPLVNHQRDASSGKSAGTYVGSDGLIKTSVVNLFRYSEQFDQSAWPKTSGITVNSNVETAPDGNLTADGLTRTGTNEFIYSASSVTGTLTLSCWVKVASGTAPFFMQSFAGVDGSQASPTKTATTEWQRFEFTVSTTASSNFYPCLGAINTTFYIWGAQLEEGSTASTYVPTTTVASGAPRFDHDPVTGESLGLLIEESRTNLLTNSNFAQSTPTTIPTDWSGWNPPTFLTSQTLSPDGVSFGLFHGALNQNGGGLRKDLTGLTAGGTYYLTFYVKGLTTSELTYFTNNNAIGTTTGNTGGALNVPWFAATRVKFNAGYLNGTGASGSAQVALTTEWKKIDGVVTADDAGSVRIIIDNNVGDVGTGNEDGGGTFLIWGAQLEAGLFQTSYIPTTSSAVTRAADVASITGTNFSSWYNQSEGTMFADFDLIGHSTYDTFIFGLNVGNTTAGKGLQIDTSTTGPVRLYLSDGSVPRPIIGALGGANTPSKATYAYSSSGIYGSLDGGVVAGRALGGALPVENTLYIGRHGGLAALYYQYGHISRLAYYPYRLSDTILQEITS